MPINKHHLKDLIERVLTQFPGLNSQAAVNLLLGTAAQESRGGTYLRQLGGGPAKGIFQMERLTFDDLLNRFSHRWPEIAQWRFEELEWDLRKAIVMARIKYFSIPRPLPPATDVAALAGYWKNWYNTPLGAGTEREFIDNYRKYVG